ncbi:MAG: hypothetical protein L0154_25410 [Chloroflexi bacterium]|nr:hypothetical protein [Chloroflexota bacterium]
MIKRVLLISFIAVGALFILWGVTSTSAQGDDEREYVGARECSSCHRDLARSHEESPHALALIGDRSTELWLADFEAGEDVRTVALPGESEARAFDEDDIAYAMGSGRYVQRYVSEVDRGEYVVLPAQWNTITGEWQPYGPVENFPDDPAYDFGFSCGACHTTAYEARRVRWEDDGVQCEACHGPGSVHVEEAEDAGNSPSDRELEDVREAIVLSPDPQICGQCHSRGVEPEDMHPFPVEYLPGGDLLDEDVFQIFPPEDETYWWATGHGAMPNMQFNEWVYSGHANSLAAVQESDGAVDECLQCHSADYRFTAELITLHDEGDREGDPPELPTLETAQFGISCVTCHNPHAEDAVAYLEVDSYTQCVECHSDPDPSDGIHEPVQQMFEGVALVEGVTAVASAHFTAEDGPECSTCHMPRVPADSTTRSSHSLDPITPGEAIEGLQDTCSTCHGEEIEAAGLQGFLDDVQGLTASRLENIHNTLSGDEAEWVNQAVMFVERDGSLGVHNFSYTNRLLSAVETELDIALVEIAQDQPSAEDVIDEIEEDVEETPADEDVEDEGVANTAYVIMGLALLLVLGAAYMFFFRKTGEENHA